MSRRLILALTAAIGWVTVLAAGPASAEPTTPVGYSSGASATGYAGLAFDQCTAPTVATMQAWSASPFRAIGVYIGGINRTCAQPQLTSSWVTSVAGMGWSLLPIYVGLQPKCGLPVRANLISSTNAATQGTAAAKDAVSQAAALGLLPGSAIYNDLENYSATGSAADVSCRKSVLTFLSAWTRQLHKAGYVSGVYANLTSGAKHLSDAYSSTSAARPDALWIARYDGNPSLSGWAGINDSNWAVHQRAKQFLANRQETYGGVTINIDRDQLNAPVATVSFRHLVTATTALGGRSGPSASAPVVASYAPGAAVKIACQIPGSAVGTSKVWDKLTNGSYIPDHYVDTASTTTYTKPISHCALPYQVRASTGVKVRTGPGTSYASAGTFPPGSLAWVSCQRGGTRIGSTGVWNKLSDGRWIADYYVATPSKSTYSKPVPRCV